MRLVFLEQCTQIVSEENDGTPLSLEAVTRGNRERPVARAYYLGQIPSSPRAFSYTVTRPGAAMTSRWKELRSTVQKPRTDSRDASIFRHHESLQAALAMEREDEDRPE